MDATALLSAFTGRVSSDRASAAQGNPHAAPMKLLLRTRVANTINDTGCIIREQDGAIRGFRTVHWASQWLVVLVEALDNREHPVRLTRLLVKQQPVNRVTCTQRVQGSSSLE